MAKLRRFLFRSKVRRILLQVTASVSLIVAVGWLIVVPDFEPLLVLLASVATLITSLFPNEADEMELAGSKVVHVFGDDRESIEVGKIDAVHFADQERTIPDAGGVDSFLDHYQQASFGGRRQELEALSKWLEQSEKRLGLMVAPAGMGKSALLVAWRDQLQRTGKAHVVYHPVSLRFGTHSRQDTIESLLVQMRDLARHEAGLSVVVGQGLAEALALMNDAFDLSELRTLCFNLAVDFENLAGERKEDKARELILLMKRRGRLDELVETCMVERPQHDWQIAFSRTELIYEQLDARNTEVLSKQLRSQLRKTPGWDKPLVVIVDGLDELADQLNQPDIKPVGFLPGKVGEGVYILVTARGVSEDMQRKWQMMLNWESTTSLQTFSLGPLTKTGIKEMVKRSEIQTEPYALEPLTEKIYRLSRKGDPLTASLLVNWVAEWQDGNVLTLDRLQNSGQFNPEPGINGYIEWVWHQLEPIASGTARPFFELLSLARGSLTGSDLYALGLKVDTSVLDELVARSGRLLVKGTAGYVLSHSRIREVVQGKFVSEETEARKKWLERFHEYGCQSLEQVKSQFANGEIPTAPAYILNHYAEHLQEDQPNGYEESLYALVDEAWMKAHFRVTKSYENFLRDVARAWETAEEIGQKEAEENKPVSTLGIQVKCALVNSSVATLLGNLPPSLPAMLVRDGIWPSKLAIEYASRIPDRLQRIRTRLALLPILSQKKNFEQAKVQIADSTLVDLADFTDRDNDELHARLLLTLFPYLTEPYQIEDAVEQAQGLRYVAWRVRLLAHLVDRLRTPQLKTNLLAEILRACLDIHFSRYGSLNRNYEEAPEEHKPYIFDAIAQNLPDGLLSDAFCIAFNGDQLGKHSNERSQLASRRTDFLKMLARHIPVEQSGEFLQACVDFQDHGSRVDPIPAIVIRLAPRLSTDGFAKAYHYLTKEVERQGERYGLASESRTIQDSPIMALIVLAHFCSEVEIKLQLQSFLVKELIFGEKSFWRKMDGGTRYKTLLALYHSVFGGLTDGELARQFADGEIEVSDTRDHSVFCLLGPQSIKVVVEQLYARHGLGSSMSSGFDIRSSPYYLADLASQLTDENLDWIMKIAGGKELNDEDYRQGDYWNLEMWGRLRAIASVARRLPSAQRDDYARFAIQKLYNFDSSLEVLKNLAGSLSIESIEELIFKYANDWRRWFLLEQIVDRLSEETRTAIRQKLYTGIKKTTYNINLAQPLVVLSMNLDSENALETWNFILAQASFIADLPARIKAVQILASRINSRTPHWHSMINRQVQEEAVAFATSVYPRRILSYLPFWQRLRVLFRLRGELSRVPGIAMRKREVLGLAIVESNHLRQIVQFTLVALAATPERFQDSLGRWLDKVFRPFVPELFSLSEWLEDVAPGKLAVWILKRHESQNDTGVAGPRDDNRGNAHSYEKILGHVLQYVHTIRDKGATEQSEVLSKMYSELRSLGVDFWQYRQLVRQHGPEIWRGLPDKLYELALQASVTDEAGDWNHLKNLLALLPGLASYRPDLLPNWREQTERFWHPNDKAILLSAVANYMPPDGKQITIKEALELSKSNVDQNEADWLCGMVLEDAAQYMPDSLLPFLAHCLVHYHHKEKWWSRAYRAAFFQVARRISSRMDLIEILWPLITTLEDSDFVGFVRVVAPSLSKEYMCKLLQLTSLKDRRDSQHLSGAYAELRTQWLELSRPMAHTIWCNYLREVSSMARPRLLHRLSWLSGIIELLASESEMVKVGGGILEVGQWQW